MSVKLSIVIPTKNEEKHLPATFASIKSQKFTDYEVIVADDSEDRTAQIAEKFGARVVKGGTVVKGRNSGARSAKGEYLLFLDADTILPNELFLEQAMTEIYDRTLDIACPDVETLSTRELDRFFYRFYNQYVRLTVSFWPHAPGFCIFARRAVHRKIGGFDAEVVFAEDHEYAQRAQRYGYRFGILNHVSPIQTSDRRFVKDGRFRTAFWYLWTELRMMFIGPYKGKMPFRYEMGGHHHKGK